MQKLTLNLADHSLESKEAVWGSIMPSSSSSSSTTLSSSTTSSTTTSSSVSSSSSSSLDSRPKTPTVSKAQLSLNLKTPPESSLKVDLNTPRDTDNNIDNNNDDDKIEKTPSYDEYLRKKRSPSISSSSSSFKVTPKKTTTHLEPTAITIISIGKNDNDNIQIKAMLGVISDGILYVYWRVHPQQVGCEMIYLKSTQIDPINSKRLKLIFVDFELLIEFETIDICSNIELVLARLMKESQQQEKDKEANNATLLSSEKTLRADAYNVAVKQEKLFQLLQALKIKDGCMLVDKIISKSIQNLTKRAFDMWTGAVYEMNKSKMIQDKERWRYHAISNQELDLQAWYHAMFYHEVYRLRGPFWHRDAVLPQYRQSYDLVDNALSPLEEAALAHVLCSPDTSYGDVAGQMFVVQQLADKQNLYALFQKLSSQGAQVIKYPRTGRPARKVFRFSFVEGKIYLTWKGKFGNQGVGLNEVTKVKGGIHTDVLKRAAAPGKANLFLSLTCLGRSVDLCFDSEGERNEWEELLNLLMLKEHGELECLKVERPSSDQLNEWLYLYSALGENCLPLEIWKKLTDKSKN